MEITAPADKRFFQHKNIAFFGLTLIGAAASVAFYRSGYFYIFFLLPLGLAGFLGESKTAWAAGIFAIALNSIVSLWFYLYRSSDPVLLQWNGLYYGIMVLVFTWINAPLGRFWVFSEILSRMVAGAVFCTLLILPALLFIMQDPRIHFFIASQQTAISSMGPGVSMPEDFFPRMIYMSLRGGFLLSCLVFWWINRQFASILYRILRRSSVNPSETFLTFRVPFFFIWIFSLSLGAILLGRTGSIEIMEITGWNLLVLSATLFFVQGGAVALFFIVRLPSFFRIIITIGIFFLFLRPEINRVLLGLFILLGITENWVLFRVPKKQ